MHQDQVWLNTEFERGLCIDLAHRVNLFTYANHIQDVRARYYTYLHDLAAQDASNEASTSMKACLCKCNSQRLELLETDYNC